RARGESRQKYERRASPRPPADPLADITGRELLAVLDEEMQKLPENHRTAVVLGYFQGKTCDEAARAAGWSLRTYKRRLEEARAILRGGLARRGLTLPAALLTAGLAGGAATAAVATQLTESTVAAVVQPGVSTAASALADGVMQTLSVTRLKAPA